MAFQTQTKKKQSIFPDFPRGTPTVNKDGNFTDNWHLGFSTLFQQLQKNFTNEGLQIPQLDETSINSIADIYTPFVTNNSPLGTTPNISGKMVYDTTNSAMKVFIITFVVSGDASSGVATAGWKTFTIV